jgi:hypothetical protein
MPFGTVHCVLRYLRMCRPFLSSKCITPPITRYSSLHAASGGQVLPSLLPLSVTLYSLHGHLPPASRTRTLSSFTLSPATPAAPSILLTTDVAARGLDLPRVDVIIQFDPPSDPKTFSHRCGRTARAGKTGRAWALLVGREEEYVGESTTEIPFIHDCI